MMYPGESGIETSDIDSNYADDRNVMRRWQLYSLSEHGGEYFETELSSSLRYSKIRSVLDVGASNASFIRLLHDMNLIRKHKITAVGVDRNSGQFVPRPNNESDVSMVNADARQLPFKNNEFQLSTSFYMLYHLPKGVAQHEALSEMKRVTVDDGLFVITTSGADNKDGSRKLEEIIAERLGTTPPPHMNSGFTTEKAEDLLPEHFKHIAVYKTADSIQLHNTETSVIPVLTARDIYIGAQLSLAGMYGNTQEETDPNFRRVVEDVVDWAFADPDFADAALRSMFVCSQEPLADSPYIDIASLGTPDQSWAA